MTVTYFVDYKLYNGDSEGWAYKTELKTTDFAEAERKYGEELKTYYGVSPFTFGLLTLTDCFGNVFEKKMWDNTSADTTTTEE